MEIKVESANDGHNVKCPRCWHYHGVVENFDNLCDRCTTVLLTDYKDGTLATAIKGHSKLQKEKYETK